MRCIVFAVALCLQLLVLVHSTQDAHSTRDNDDHTDKDDHADIERGGSHDAHPKRDKDDHTDEEGGSSHDRPDLPKRITIQNNLAKSKLNQLNQVLRESKLELEKKNMKTAKQSQGEKKGRRNVDTKQRSDGGTTNGGNERI